MTMEMFAEWFKTFVALVTERPLLLIFHGHLTHVSVNVIEKAIEENITIVKLPPHVTDKLQPLDVSCFGPLKVTVDLRGVFWGKQYSALCFNGNNWLHMLI